MYEDLARNDLGSVGSYGGGTHDGNGPISRRPVVLVHGITNNAGSFYRQRDVLLRNGWTPDTVYLTTYGSGSSAETPSHNVAMNCAFVQQMRNFITVVAAFTQQKVDVLAYSLGSPIVRKAILGGTCVDNWNVNLGGPLTNLVENFVSIGGANRATFLCPFTITNACNNVNGLHCRSNFLRDVNAYTNYEGSHIFSIYGVHDDKVGWTNLPCGTVNSRIDGSEKEFANATGNHNEILSGTIYLQMNLLKDDS